MLYERDGDPCHQGAKGNGGEIEVMIGGTGGPNLEVAADDGARQPGARGVV